MSKLYIGWSEVNITPDKKISLAGQFAERISEYVEKPLTATAMAVECGGDQMIMISTDLVAIGMNLEEEIRVLNRQIQAMEASADKAQEKIDKFELWCDHQQTLLNAKDIEMIKLLEELNYFKSHCQDLETHCSALETNCRTLEDRCKGLEKGTVYFVLRKIKRLFSK